MKKYFDGVKTRFNAMDEDEKIMALVGTLVVLVIVMGLMFLVLALIKAAFVPAMIGLALYAVGVKAFNWPIPKFVKKFFK